MHQGEHSAILLTFIKLPFVIKIFVLSIFERPLKTGITVSFLQESSADNLCKQFQSRSGPTDHWVLSGSKLFDTLVVFLKEFFQKVEVP